MIYLGTKGHVVSVDPATGAEAWRTRLTTGGLLNATSWGDVTVIADGTSLIAGCNGHLFGLDPRDGSVLWHNPLRGLGNGHICVAMPGVSVQYIKRVQTQNTSS